MFFKRNTKDRRCSRGASEGKLANTDNSRTAGDDEINEAYFGLENILYTLIPSYNLVVGGGGKAPRGVSILLTSLQSIADGS